MFSQGIKAYSEVSVDSAVQTANPVQIVVLLYEGAMTAVAQAKGSMERKNIAEKSRLITKAVAIIEGLRSAIDHSQGGDIALQLADLYLYMIRQLTLGNLRNDPALLDEVYGLLSELNSAWNELSRNSAAGARPSSGPKEHA